MVARILPSAPTDRYQKGEKFMLDFLMQRSKRGRSRQISWSEIVVTHEIEKYDDPNKMHIKEERKKGLQKRKTFRSAADAVETTRRRAVQDLAKQYQLNIRSNLAYFKIKETIQTSLIEELDSLREVDPNDGYFCGSEEYVILEKKLFLFLEILDYTSNCEKIHGHPCIVVPPMLLCDDMASSQMSRGNKQCFSFLFSKKIAE
jgi:hypothetical protein